MRRVEGEEREHRGLEVLDVLLVRLGAAAAELLFRMLAGETPDAQDSLVIAPTLAVRGSTAGGFKPGP